MKTQITLLLAVTFWGLAATSLQAQIAINSSAANPDSSTILDLNTGNAGNKGFLAPQVALLQTTFPNPVTNPAMGLIVYNTATSGIAPYNVVPGYYYWNSSVWTLILALDAGTSGQVLTSNGGGNPSWTNPSNTYDTILKAGNGIKLIRGAGSNITVTNTLPDTAIIVSTGLSISRTANENTITNTKPDTGITVGSGLSITRTLNNLNIVNTASDTSIVAGKGISISRTSTVNTISNTLPDTALVAGSNITITRSATKNTISSIIPNVGVAGTYNTVTTNAQGQVISGTDSIITAGNNISISRTGGNLTIGTLSSITPHGKQMFTSSGTFTVPAGDNIVWITMCGGGGGGCAGISSGVWGGGGGGAEAIIATPVSVTPLQNIVVTIGAGGSACNSGGTSSFGALSTNGGGGGTNTGSGGAAGGSGGITGNHGFGTGSISYPFGGSSIFGSGGLMSDAFNGNSGGGFGAGGAGCAPTSSTPGNGSPGFVLVEW